MTAGSSGDGRSRMDPAEMQLLLTGVREALEEVRKQRSVPRFRHTAEPALFVSADRGPDAPTGEVSSDLV